MSLRLPLFAVLLSCFAFVACDAGGGSRAVAGAGGHAVADHPYAKPGFVAVERDGRLWVFRAGSEALAEFERVGEPAKHVTRVGDGPGGMTIKGTDKETLVEYLAHKDGWHTDYQDGILWVFRAGSESLADYLAHGEPGKNATVIGEGPLGVSVRSEDKSAIVEYLADKPGFHVEVSDGLLWVFHEGSEALAEFERVGEPGKNATLVGIGPLGMSVRSENKGAILDWMVSAPGYETHLRDGRIWVFRPGSEALIEFIRVGEPAKHVTRIGVGPMGKTVKAPTGELLDAYLADLQ